MNPLDMLKLAETLSEADTEVEWRCSVGRAYYAAFHIGSRLLCQCGFEVPGGEHAHAYVWLRLSNCGHFDVKNAGSDIRELRRMRNWADYELHRFLDQSLAFDQVKMASEVIQLLEQIEREPPILARIVDGIKVYERDVLREKTWRE